MGSEADARRVAARERRLKHRAEMSRQRPHPIAKGSCGRYLEHAPSGTSCAGIHDRSTLQDACGMLRGRGSPSKSDGLDRVHSCFTGSFDKSARWTVKRDKGQAPNARYWAQCSAGASVCKHDDVMSQCLATSPPSDAAAVNSLHPTMPPR